MTLEHRPAPSGDGGVDRLNTLTDGVVAIAITLLALDLRPDLPSSTTSGQLAHYLNERSGQFGAFGIAFFLIAQYWMLHHRMTRDVRRSSPQLVRVTLVFLFGITLAPLTASMTGTFSNELSVVLFALNVLLISVAAGTLSEIVHRHHLADRREVPEDRIRRRTRAVVSFVIPALVAGLAPVLGDHATWFYLLFTVANLPGRLVLRRVNRRQPAAR